MLEFARCRKGHQTFVGTVPQVKAGAFEAFAQVHAAAGICQLFMIAQHFRQTVEWNAAVQVVYVGNADVGREPLQNWRQIIV